MTEIPVYNMFPSEIPINEITKLEEWERADETNAYNQTLQAADDFVGPVEGRGCTDAICLLLFLLANGALAALAGYSKDKVGYVWVTQKG